MLAVCVLPSGAWSLLLVLKNRDENSSGIDRVLWRLVGMVSWSPELCREMLTCVALARLSSGGIVVRPVEFRRHRRPSGCRPPVLCARS